MARLAELPGAVEGDGAGVGWPCYDLEEASEALRTWRLSCIRAEAELRAGGLDVSGGSTEASDTLLVLGEVLALERHLGDWQARRAEAEAEAQSLRHRAEASGRLSQEEAGQLAQALQATVLLSERTGGLLALRRELFNGHAQRCEAIGAQAPAPGAAALCSALREVQRHLEALRATEAAEAAEAEAARQEQERLLMQQEDFRMRKLDLLDGRCHSLREISWAKRAGQSRAATLTKLQNEALRVRSRADRLRRQAEGQLAHCRGELVDAAVRADVAGEQLRKVKQQHGRQLRMLRATTGDLKQEVDAHLLFMEASEEELRALGGEELELERCRERRAEQRRLLESQSEALGAEVDSLRAQLAASEGTWRTTCSQLRSLEMMSVAEARANEEEESYLQGLSQRLGGTEAIVESLRRELQEELTECKRQSPEVERLRALEDQTWQARGRRDLLMEEHSQLHEGTKQLQRACERHDSELQEALRRTHRLRASHTELVEAFRPSSATAPKVRAELVGGADQAVSRAAKRAEALLNCLDGPRKPAMKNVTSSGAGGGDAAGHGSSKAMQRCQALLQRRLRADLDSEMEAALAVQRRRLVAEQGRAAEEARRRTEALTAARRGRRELESELVTYQFECKLSRQRNECQGEALEAQFSLLEKEADQSAQAMAAEFADLLQKQALERDSLRMQVADLRRQLDAAASGEAAAAGPEAVAERGELEQLCGEHEELHQALVKLKAAVVANGGTLPPAPENTCPGVGVQTSRRNVSASQLASSPPQFADVLTEAAALQLRASVSSAIDVRSGSVGSTSSLSTVTSAAALQGARPVTPLQPGRGHSRQHSAGAVGLLASVATPSLRGSSVRTWPSPGTASPALASPPPPCGTSPPPHAGAWPSRDMPYTPRGMVGLC